MGGLAGTAAKLLASLDLDTKPFERGAKRAGVVLGGMEKRFGKIGGIAQKGIGNLATNLTRIGVIAAGAIAVAVKSGIQSLADLERVTNATGAVIESTGGKAGVTAGQVRALAESLESVTTADDKLIQSGENMLLTFTNIGSDIFPQATKSMVDLAIAMAEGDVENANFQASAKQIGKALQDPVRGMTALRKSGVSFSKEQEALIKKLVESGDVMGAQQVILKELEVEFGKAGQAAGKGFGGDMRKLDDAFEDSRMALATGFLPVIRKVADKLSTELVKPEVQRQIREFGDTLAGAFDKVLEIGGKLPWGQIGDSLKLAGQGAKAVFDAFAGMPAWVQTAVLTGWGLNKLSGGALTSLLGEGIKVTFSQFAARGATPANPVYVQGAGVGGAGGATGGGVSGLVGGAIVGAVFTQAAFDATTIFSGFKDIFDAGDKQDPQAVVDAIDRVTDAVVLLPPPVKALMDAYTSFASQQLQALERPPAPQGMSPDERQKLSDLSRKADKQRTAVEKAKSAIDWSKRATDHARTAITSTESRNADRIVRALYATRATVNVNMSQTTIRYGSGQVADWRWRAPKIPAGEFGT